MAYTLFAVSARDVTSARERLEVEMETQAHKIEEQKAHIDILDQALVTAQTNALKLDDEVCTVFLLLLNCSLTSSGLHEI